MLRTWFIKYLCEHILVQTIFAVAFSKPTCELGCLALSSCTTESYYHITRSEIVASFGPPPISTRIISQKVFIKSFCKSQFPHRSVELSFIITNLKSKLTDLCGNWLLHNVFINTLCEIKTVAGNWGPFYTNHGHPLSSEFGTIKTVRASSWPWLEPFWRQRPLKPFKLLPSRSAAASR